ncbi:hypothetical protein GCM10027084_26340 [Pseudoxanthomonas sangjuensis]
MSLSGSVRGDEQIDDDGCRWKNAKGQALDKTLVKKQVARRVPLQKPTGRNRKDDGKDNRNQYGQADSWQCIASCHER